MTIDEGKGHRTTKVVTSYTDGTAFSPCIHTIFIFKYKSNAPFQMMFEINVLYECQRCCTSVLHSAAHPFTYVTLILSGVSFVIQSFRFSCVYNCMSYVSFSFSFISVLLQLYEFAASRGKLSFKSGEVVSSRIVNVYIYNSVSVYAIC